MFPGVIQFPGIAETTGVRWRSQGQGEKTYELMVWICMDYLGVTWVLHGVAVRPLEESLFWHPVIHFVQTGGTGGLYRQAPPAAGRGSTETAYTASYDHCNHCSNTTARNSKIRLFFICSSQSCFAHASSPFLLGFAIQDRAGLPACFLLGPEHIKGFGRTACGHRKQPSVVSLDEEQHRILIPII